jgi:hypothetical protein
VFVLTFLLDCRELNRQTEEDPTLKIDRPQFNSGPPINEPIPTKRRTRFIRLVLILAIASSLAACGGNPGPTALIYRDHPVLVGPTLFLATPDVEPADSRVLDTIHPSATFSGAAEYIQTAATSTTSEQTGYNTVTTTTTTTVTKELRDDVNKQHYRATRGRNDVVTRIELIRSHCWGTFPVVFAWGECQVTIRGAIYKEEDVQQVAGRKSD